MAGSIDRVNLAARNAGLEIEIRRMGESTRTAQDAANQCGCTVGQIVKSLIFEGKDTGRLMLFLVSGDRQFDLTRAAALTGENLKRADPRRIREETGFAIGGVSPLGHKIAIAAYADRTLLDHDVVWAAAGAHDAVFSAEPNALVRAASAVVADLAV
ncbi:MAG: YbaK/EbsC family protein [Hyphomicrobiales bacterium]|nr:YbaK/EbsC family protein [Hyphomicrobiales bacterium]